MTKVTVYKSNSKIIYGFTLPNEMEQLPTTIKGKPVIWQKWKDIDIDENSPLIAADPKEILDGIAENGFYVAGASVNIYTVERKKND